MICSDSRWLCSPDDRWKSRMGWPIYMKKERNDWYRKASKMQ